MGRREMNGINVINHVFLSGTGLIYTVQEYEYKTKIQIQS